MRNFLGRVERAMVRFALRPELRPAEHAAAVALARNVLVRVGASGAVVAMVVELIDRFVA